MKRENEIGIRTRTYVGIGLTPTATESTAQVIPGCKNLTVFEIYAEKNVEQAMRIMAQVG